MADYTYSVSGDITAGQVYLPGLGEEIQADLTPIPGFQGIDLASDLDTLTISFSGTLTAPQIAALDAVVLAHSGVAPPDTSTEPQEVTAAPGVNDDETAGYAIGTIVVDTVTDTSYICLDNATGAAVWVELDDASDPRDPNAHAATHIKDGTDEIDGDHLDIDFTPSNYTPSTTPAEAGDVDHLAAHLAGIDDALATIPSSPNVAREVGPISTTNASAYALVTEVTGISIAETGTFIVECDYMWAHDSVSSDFLGRIQIQIDGGGYNTLGQIHREEPADSLGSGGPSGTDQRITANLVRWQSVTAGQTVDIRFEISTSQINNTSTVWDVQLKGYEE